MIDKKLYDKVQKILTDQIGKNTIARETFISEAWFGDPKLINRVDFTGSSLVFTNHIIDLALKYGQLATGEYAVTALLRNAKKIVGPNKQSQIDGLVIALQPQLETRSYEPYFPESVLEASQVHTDKNAGEFSKSFYLFSEDEDVRIYPSKIPAIIGRPDSRDPSVEQELGINLGSLKKENRSRVSRKHAVIDMNSEGKFVIETLPDKRPIEINGVQHTPGNKHVLNSGDTILIGHAHLIFYIPSSNDLK